MNNQNVHRTGLVDSHDSHANHHDDNHDYHNDNHNDANHLDQDCQTT